MTPLRSLVARARDMVRGRQLDRELDAEFAAHIDEAAEDFERQGFSPAEARRAALLRFGSVTQAREAHREVRSFPWMVDRWREYRYAGRSLRRAPGFSLLATLILALGIGATTAVFSVVYGVLLKPLPFSEPDRLVALYHVTPASRRDAQGAATYFTYRDHGRAFEDIGLWNTGTASVTRNGTPEQVQVLRVSDGTLSLLGVRATAGRLLGREDDAADAPVRVLLSHAFWRQAFGGSREIVGRTLQVDGRSSEVIGVLPSNFRLRDIAPDLVLPLRLDRATTRTGALPFNGIARLKPNVTLAQANADIARMIPMVAERFPLMGGLTRQMWDDVGLAPNVRPLSEDVIGEMGRPLWILLGTAGIVLLMAWTNVANLLLVRAEGRRKEFAVRAALGGGRWRIASELMSESVILGLAGGALGVLFAWAAVAVLCRTVPVGLPRVQDIGINGIVLLVALVSSLVTSVLFGLIPAVRLRETDVEALKEAGRSMTDAPGRHRVRNVLVVSQIAGAVVLLIVFGLMGRTVVAMRQVQPGFVRPAELQTFDLALPAALVADDAQVTQTFRQIVERLQHVPGVVGVGLAGSVGMSGVPARAPIYVDGRPVSELPATRSIRIVGEGYFETMGNPIVAGRTITWTDIIHREPVALIANNLAREYWDSPARAVGQRISMFPGGPWLEIVGVAGDERADGLNQPPPALAYFPMADKQSVSRRMTFVVRSSRAGNADFLRDLEHAVWSVNRSVPLARARTMAAIQADSMAQTSFAVILLAIAASGALLLAIAGIYAVVSYIAASRTHEVGLRVALGAQHADVRRLFVRHGLALTLVGIGLGIGAARLLAPVLSSLLYGVTPTDPLTYTGVAIVLGAVTLFATYLPARRATRIDPVVALRNT